MATTNLITVTKRINTLLAAEFAADQGVNVFIGQFVTDDPSTSINVGWSGGDADEPLLARSDSEWAGLGARKRDEVISVLCSLLLLEGRTDPAGLAAGLDRMQPLLERAEAALRTDPSLGLPTPCTAGLVNHALYTYPGGDVGLLLRLAFTVSVRTRN